MASRSGMGRVTTAVVVIILIVVAFSVSLELNSRRASSITSSSTKSTVLLTSQTTRSSTPIATSQASSSSVTKSSSSTSTGCTFTPPPPLVVYNNTVTPTFTGCLTPGATGTYLLAIADPNNIVATGVVRTQNPANISLLGHPVLNYTAAATVAGATPYAPDSVNDTTALPLNKFELLAPYGYSITVVNQSGENNTVTIMINFEDAAAFEGF